MDPFRRRLSLLLVLLVLSGCGSNRPGTPYPVTFGPGVLIAPTKPTAVTHERSSSSSGSCNLNVGSGCKGGNDLAAIVVVIAVVIVVVVVVVAVISEAVNASHQDQDPDQYYLTLSGSGHDLAVVPITYKNRLYLTKQQYQSLVKGVYTRAVIRPALCDGSRSAPTQEVTLTVARGRITINPVQIQAQESTPASRPSGEASDTNAPATDAPVIAAPPTSQ